MKAIILAGGFGTRLMEETKKIPKPMVKIGRRPIIWHLCKYLSNFKITEIIICGGYKYKVLENYFKNEKINNCNIVVKNTGLNSLTGQRIKKIYKYVKKDEFFFLTYGDGLADININKLVKFHKQSNKLVTITAVNQIPRWGKLILKKNLVTSFEEKKMNYNDYINGGYFIVKPEAIKFIKGNVAWEQSPLKIISKKKQLVAYKHKKFWYAMDTLREKKELEKMIKNKKAPWIIW